MTTERTIAFVDLAGFTAVNEVHGDDAALGLIDTFAAMARAAADEHGAQLVKTIGDAVMFAASSPTDGISAVAALVARCHLTDQFLQPRSGLHHGPVIARDGDYYGSTVNLAARVAAAAGSDQVLGTAPIAAAAGRLEVEVVGLGCRRLRNVAEPVELWVIEVGAPPADLAVDPVCRMRIDPRRAAGRIRHDGTDHWLCSSACLQSFVSDPERFVVGDRPPDPRAAPQPPPAPVRRCR